MEEIIIQLMDEERYEEALTILMEHENDFMDREEMLSRKAWLLNRLERFQEALIVLDELNAVGRDDIWYYSQVGYAKSRIDDYDGALDAYFQASNLGRDDAWLDIEIASVYGKMEYYEEAKVYLIQAFDKEPESIWTNSQLGYTFVHLGDLKSAYDYYYNCFQLGRNDVWIFSELAWVCNKLGKFDEAITYLERMTEDGYIDDWCRLEYGVSYNGKGDYEQALSYINQIEDHSLHGYLSEKAYALVRTDKLDEALELYLQIEYKDLFVNLDIANIYSIKGDYEKEEPYLKEVAKYGYRQPFYLQEMAKIESYIHQDYQKAIDLLKELDALVENDVWTIAEIGWNYECLEDYKTALTYYLQCVELKRNDVFINYRLCRVYEALENVDLSYEYIEKAEALSTEDDIDILCTKAHLLCCLNRPQEALETLNRVPYESAWVYIEYGIIYRLLGDPKASTEAFKKALELDPENALIHQQLGRNYYDDQNYELAYKHYYKILEDEKDNDLLMYRLGVCLDELGQSKKAVAYLEACLALDPLNVDAKNRLKKLKAKRGLFGLFTSK